MQQKWHYFLLEFIVIMLISLFNILILYGSF